jgi:hypothetical protein
MYSLIIPVHSIPDMIGKALDAVKEQTGAVEWAAGLLKDVARARAGVPLDYRIWVSFALVCKHEGYNKPADIYDFINEIAPSMFRQNAADGRGLGPDAKEAGECALEAMFYSIMMNITSAETNVDVCYGCMRCGSSDLI